MTNPTTTSPLVQARRLRAAMTRTEAMLWQRLRRRGLGGRKFRRQHPVGGVIVDFACVSHKVAVEIDGEIHKERRGPDRRRDEFLRRSAYVVLRFEDWEVETDLEGVVRRIEAGLSQRAPPPPRSARGLPPEGGDETGDQQG